VARPATSVVLTWLLSSALWTAGSGQSSPLFRDATPLSLQLQTDLRALFRDRGDERAEHDAILRFSDGQSSRSLNVELRTRGIFRLKRCPFPPLRLDLPKEKVENTPFEGQNKLKLVTHCQSDRLYERNLLREYALYRAFNAVTDTSFRVRLARLTYIDSSRSDTLERYGFLIESDLELAQRIGAQVFEASHVHDLVTDASYMTLVSVFQYLIGNTDWSVWVRHNIAVLRSTADPNVLFAVPYDFDFSGAVNAPYAAPPPQLPIRSVRERLYRGYCQPESVLAGVLERFRSAKDSIYAAVRTVPDLSERDVRSILDYFDDFFRSLERGALQREFTRGCRRVEQ
jgi:hypothetical protein